MKTLIRKAKSQTESIQLLLNGITGCYDTRQGQWGNHPCVHATIATKNREFIEAVFIPGVKRRSQHVDFLFPNVGLGLPGVDSDTICEHLNQFHPEGTYICNEWSEHRIACAIRRSFKGSSVTERLLRMGINGLIRARLSYRHFMWRFAYLAPVSEESLHEGLVPSPKFKLN